MAIVSAPASFFLGRNIPFFVSDLGGVVFDLKKIAEGKCDYPPWNTLSMAYQLCNGWLVEWLKYTLPETNSCFLLGWPIFRGELLVFGSVDVL